jgi:hypothetical protein
MGLQTLGKEKTGTLHKKGKAVRRQATKAYDSTVPVILTLVLCGLEESHSRSVSLILGKRVPGAYEMFQSFLSGQLEEQINLLSLPQLELLLIPLPQSHPAHYVDYSRIMSTSFQSFCMINTSASLHNLVVLLPQPCEGSCYVVHSSNWRNRQTYTHTNSRTLPTCDINSG